LWRSEGIVTQVHLKLACAASLIGSIICIIGSYFHTHISWSSMGFRTKLTTLSVHHLSLLLGLGSISWSGHVIHISAPINCLLDSGVDPAIIPSPQDLLFSDYQEIIFPTFGASPITDSQSPLCYVAAHHFYLGIVLIIGGICIDLTGLSLSNMGSNHCQLSISLVFFSSSSIVFANHIYAMPVYPYLLSDYPTVVSLFYHHLNIGCFLTIGAGAHASIFMIRDESDKTQSYVQEVLNHRCLILGHLIYLSVALGLHSFGLYIHNDTLQALGRPDAMFSDNSIQLKPVFSILVQSLNLVSFDIEVLDGKVIRSTQELGTADFMVHHIHALTIHITLLILLKGVLYARSSRLVSDKLDLGWRYPCDGPGRGGTCQISPYDHLYLAAFWMYNSLSIVLFHYFWKIQSDVFGTLDVTSQKIQHISGSDFSVNSNTINGWLRNFLWAKSAQVIQSYSTSISAYGLIFLCAHFVWAFSLMFLYSGRGYWQELIESILWAHHKLNIINLISPRALSISQGRAVGLTHYILGGIASTWAFVLSRIIALA